MFGVDLSCATDRAEQSRVIGWELPPAAVLVAPVEDHVKVEGLPVSMYRGDQP